MAYGIPTGGFLLASFDSDHLPIGEGFAIWITQCATVCWASASSVWGACIKLFTAEYNASEPGFSNTVSCPASSGRPENSHIV
jgi:hypothetical protein